MRRPVFEKRPECDVGSVVPPARDFADDSASLASAVAALPVTVREIYRGLPVTGCRPAWTRSSHTAVLPRPRSGPLRDPFMSQIVPDMGWIWDARFRKHPLNWSLRGDSNS